MSLRWMVTNSGKPPAGGVLYSASAQWIPGFARKMTVDLQHFHPRPDLAGRQKPDAAGNRGDKLVRHALGKNDFGWRRQFGAENLGDPILLELRFAHVIDRFQ